MQYRTTVNLRRYQGIDDDPGEIREITVDAVVEAESGLAARQRLLDLCNDLDFAGLADPAKARMTFDAVLQ